MFDIIPQAWLLGLIGGLLIGGASALFLLVNGRILGASGILGGLVDGSGSDNTAERLAFLGGLVLVPAVVVAATGPAATHLTANPLLLVVGGLLVGVGTRMANGCTSGHGVSGLSRFSTRSIVATGAFLAAGFVTMYLGRHILGAF